MTDRKVIGVSEVGTPRRIGLAVADGRFHVHIPGATGAGKSTLITNLILQDAAAGRGVIAVDPKGDLITDLLNRLPASVAGRLVIIDPADTNAPPAFNALEGADPALVADQLVSVFRRVFASYWGPRTDDILRCACLTLAGLGGATLAQIPRLLTDQRFRAPLVSAIRDDPGLGSFWSWYESLTPNGQAAAAGPLLSRLRSILSRPFIADLLGCSASSFSMTKVLDGGVLLARLPKGVVGEETARLVGSLLVAKAWQAATMRAAVPEHRRRDAALYLDECHNFLNLPGALEDILAEARGYHLSLVLAHQHLSQLPKELGSALSANARNKICFAISPEDATVLVRHLGPVLTDYDLSHLGGYQVAVRLLANGKEAPAFTLRTLPAPPVMPGRSETLRASARERFGLTRKQRRAEEISRRLPTAQRPVRRSPQRLARRSRDADLPFDNWRGQEADTGPSRNSDSWDEP